MQTEASFIIRNGRVLTMDEANPRAAAIAVAGNRILAVGPEAEIDAYEERLRAGAGVWEAAGGYAPTLGILGAVLGLMHVMQNMSDPTQLGAGVAVAFVATVYGIGLANLVFLPAASKLRALVDAQVRERELVLEGLIAVMQGENPKVLELRLAGYLAG